MTLTETSPTTPAALPGGSAFIPPNVQDRVTIAPPSIWVTVRPVDETASVSAAGAQTVLLFDRQFRVLTGERYERHVRLLKTNAAVQEMAQWRLDFDPGTQRVTIHSITVRRAGQCFEQAAAERLRFLQREENLERFVIDGMVTLVLLLEDVRVGDIVDVSYTVQTQQRLLPENFWLLCHIPTQVPLRAFHLTVRYPNSRALRWKGSDDDFSPVFHKLGEESEWHWKLEEVRPREIEQAVPARYFVNPWLQVSDCGSWQMVAAGVCAAWPENFDEPEFVEAATQIAASVATPAERADRALTLVQDEIRHLPLSSGLGAQIPASPGAVLRRRFGDCQDKAFLAAHLLRRLGIPARPVLVNAALRQTVEQLLPMPEAFDHVVVEYEIADKRRWADVTVPMQGGGALARPVIDFRLGLPLGPGVEGLDRVLATPGLSDIYELRETFTLDTAGRPSMLKVMIKAAGSEAENLRRELNMEGGEAVARKREKFYRQFFTDLRRVGELEWRDDRPRNEMVLAEMFEIRGAVAPGREAQTCVFEYRSHLIQSVLGFSDTGTRRQPFGLRHPCQVHHWIEVESPALEGAPGQTTPGRDLAFRYCCEFNRQYGRIIAHYSLRTLADLVKAERFEQFKDKIREIWPSTFIEVALPLGIISPRRNRAAASLLPIAPPPRKDKGRNGSSEEPPVVDLTLPPASAPALLSAPRTEDEGASAAPEDVEPKSETPRTPSVAKRLASPQSAAAFSDPTSTAAQPRDRRKRRRSHRTHWKKPLRIALFVFAAVIVVWLLIILNLRKG